MAKISKSSGIYAIVNKINGKRYIGSAVSFKKRWYIHVCRLRKGTHHSPKLQNGWNKYGEESFEFVELECCEKEELIKREQHWIDELRPFYNIAKLAGSSLGIKRSEELKKRLSDIRKGKIPWNKGLKLEKPPWNKGLKLTRPPWNKGLKLEKPPWNKGIKTGPLSEEFKRNRALSSKLMWSKRTSEQRKAIIDKMKQTPEQRKVIVEKIKQTRIKNNSYRNSEETIKKIRKKISELQGRAVDQYDLSGNFMRTFQTGVEAKKATGAKNICKVCKRQSLTSGGFIWKYNMEQIKCLVD